LSERAPETERTLLFFCAYYSHDQEDQSVKKKRVVAY